MRNQVLFTITILALTMLCHNAVVAQHYLGIGAHIAPPMKMDNCCNSFVEAKPILTPSFSISYKRIWNKKNKDTWYGELGFTKIGLGYNLIAYSSDTINIWTEYNLRHSGFPAVFIGVGKVVPLRRHDVSFGLEGSYRIAHDLEGIFSTWYGVDYSTKDLTFPFFLKINGAYNIPFKWFKKIPAHLQFYGKASWQNIARGPQYIVDPATGTRDDTGKYRLNNSELGVKIYTDMGKEHYKLEFARKEKKTKRKRVGPSDIRLSAELQQYAPPATKYHIPQIPDSFSLDGLKFSLTYQVGLKVEFGHFNNDNWSTVFGIGFGKTTSTTHFIAQPVFTRDSLFIDTPNGGIVGYHLIPNIGLAYKHPVGKKYLQHSLSAILVIPITREDESIIVVERSFLSQPLLLSPKILEGDIKYEYGRSTVLPGIEYQLEILFRMDKPVFYGLGLVFNYSHGVIAQGRVRVDNGRTSYYGAIIQDFSKIGITFRMGWNNAKAIRQ